MGHLGRFAREAAPLTVTAAGLLIVLPLGIGQPIVALVVAIALVPVVVAGIVGFEAAGAAAIVMAMFFAPLDNIRPVASLSFISMADLLWTAGFALLLPVLVSRRLVLPPAFSIAALGIIATGGVASLLAEDPGTSFQLLLRLVVGAFGLPVLFVLWSPPTKTVIPLAAAYLVGASINTIGALTIARIAGGRQQGFTNHPNIMGVCAVLAIALTPYLWASVRHRHRWWIIGCAGLCAYGIWITGSRTALLAFLFVVATYPLLTRSIPAALAVSGAGVVGFTSIGQFLQKGSADNPLVRLFGGGTASYSDNTRVEQARLAFDKFQGHPVFGVGFETTGLGSGWGAHNIYLQVAAATGVIGVLCFLIVMAMIARPALLGARPQGLISLPALIYALIGPTIPFLWDRYIWCMLALGLLATETYVKDREEAALAEAQATSPPPTNVPQRLRV